MDRWLTRETVNSRAFTESDFTEFERNAVYRSIRSRRDIRHFRSDPIPDAALARIVQAAHHGPSVGFMQPWDFLLVRDVPVRQEVQKLFLREREAASCFFDEPRRSQYLSLKLEGILESPINLCVTCDPTRGDVVLGRNAIPETDIYSTCCAVENLWLAARSEGIGVGWVSILKLPQLRKLLGIPAHIVPVAYLCLGYPVEFQDRPLLESVGWRQRIPLEELLHFDNWQQRSPEGGAWPGLDQALKLEAEDYKPGKPSLTSPTSPTSPI
ncbi:MAG TPA: 5,6-dimethylbenzimidazole synthase [Dehalococcoidia bacterium]|nr:5,6-dimethylbenzimidazole synthase [Dehalococcoidia bacterium]